MLQRAHASVGADDAHAAAAGICGGPGMWVDRHAAGAVTNIAIGGNGGNDANDESTVRIAIDITHSQMLPLQLQWSGWGHRKTNCLLILLVLMALPGAGQAHVCSLLG
jgi:hypothetical protein